MFPFHLTHNGATDEPKIIMIDDDETLCDLVKVNLTPRGYEVIGVNDSNEAILAVQKKSAGLNYFRYYDARTRWI